MSFSYWFCFAGGAAFSFVAFINCVSSFTVLQGDVLWHFRIK